MSYLEPMSGIFQERKWREKVKSWKKHLINFILWKILNLHRIGENNWEFRNTLCLIIEIICVHCYKNKMSSSIEKHKNHL